MNQNNISTNIFGHENKRLHPIYLSKEKFENCTALLLIGNEDKSQYVYIKDFLIDLRILKQNIKAKSIFVWAVYNALVLNKVVNFSIKVCLEIYVKEATKMPEKDSNAFFFLSGFSFTSIHDSQDCRGSGGYLSPLCHFHPLHRHLDISQGIAAESSPLGIASSRTRTRNLRFPSASH